MVRLVLEIPKKYKISLGLSLGGFNKPVNPFLHKCIYKCPINSENPVMSNFYFLFAYLDLLFCFQSTDQTWFLRKASYMDSVSFSTKFRYFSEHNLLRDGKKIKSHGDKGIIKDIYSEHYNHEYRSLKCYAN